MLTITRDFILNLVKSSIEIKLEDAIIHDEKKLAVVMSKKGYMASFEVVSNFEYDFLVIDSNDESIIFNKYKKLNDIMELLMEIKTDYNDFIEK